MPATKAKTTRKPVKRVPVQAAKQAVIDLRRAAQERSGIRYAGKFKSLNSIPGWNGAGESDLGSLYSQSPWAKRCVDLRANALASVNWGIFDADDEELEEHALITLLSTVDGETNWDDLIRMTDADRMIYGSAYWMKVYGKSPNGEVEGRVPIRIRRLNPSTMSVDADTDGITGFVQTLEGKPTKFKREEIVYFHDYDPLNDLGAVSCADVARTAIESEANADRYISSFFANRAAPDIIFETEQELDDADFARMRRTLKKDYKGVDKMHKTMVTEKGMKAHVISFPIGDLALEAVRLEARRSICAAFQVPMSIAGADASANYATADAERKSLYTETVMPDGEYIAGVINAELCADFGPDVHFEWKFDELPIMQPDAASEANRLATLVEKGIITPLCAALELGFSEEDVPEKAEPVIGEPNMPPQPGVTPPALAPFAQATEDVGQAEVAETPQKSADLKRWMKKSLARVKAGKSADVDFESEEIPDAMKAAILGQLEDCKTSDEVKHVFHKATIWRGYP